MQTAISSLFWQTKWTFHLVQHYSVFMWSGGTGTWTFREQLAWPAAVWSNLPRRNDVTLHMQLLSTCNFAKNWNVKMLLHFNWHTLNLHSCAWPQLYMVWTMLLWITAFPHKFMCHAFVCMEFENAEQRHFTKEWNAKCLPALPNSHWLYTLPLTLILIF